MICAAKVVGERSCWSASPIIGEPLSHVLLRSGIFLTNSWILATARAGGAIGVFYWEPTWVATPGNDWDPANISGSGNQWDNQAIFNWTGNINPSIKWTP